MGLAGQRNSMQPLRLAGGVAVLVLMLAGCTSDEPEAEGGDDPTAEGVPTDGAETNTPTEAGPTETTLAWEPSETVTFLVPGSPGGGGDILFRNLQSFMQDAYPDVTVRVENRPGAGTAIAYTELLGHEGDPHILSLLFSGLITLPIDQADLEYTWTDFTALAITELDTQFLVLSSDSEWSDFESYADYAEQEGVMNVGVAGAASRSDISTRQVAEELGVEHNPVYLQSGGDIMRALLAGDVEIAALSSQEFIGQAEAGDVVPVLTLGEEAVPQAPLDEVPVAADVLGFAPDGVDFKGAVGAGGITEDQVEYWTTVLTDWADSPAYNEHIEDSLLLKNVISGDELTEFLQSFEEDYMESAS